MGADKFRFHGAFGVDFLFVGETDCCSFSEGHHCFCSFMRRIPQRYLRACLSLPQSSLSGRLTRVVRKKTAV